MSGLLDFLQSASNTAADTVAAPVDLLSLLLRKAGVPIPQAPVGGSEWMKGKGLMVDVPQSGASLAGETFGLLSPVVAAAKAPQIARGLLNLGDDFQRYNQALGPAGASHVVAYHGTDAADIARFNTDGHHAQRVAGAYFSKNPKEASRYAKRPGGVVYKVDVDLKNPALRSDLDNLPRRINGEFADGVQTRKMLQDLGFDGLIDDYQDEIVAFSPSQIRFLLSQPMP